MCSAFCAETSAKFKEHWPETVKKGKQAVTAITAALGLQREVCSAGGINWRLCRWKRLSELYCKIRQRNAFRYQQFEFMLEIRFINRWARLVDRARQHAQIHEASRRRTQDFIAERKQALANLLNPPSSTERVELRLFSP